eukprot:TRINITY_DN1858_c0_g1_i2.p1 TRINITY_DN1858_c0_g1~~TRINITY_DN1858_c0_g1_i2.p1  ORF type:complete len:210 (-),score=32.23 TRINITY_DN1858_c0_g1_i2:265-894(-)
MAKVYMKRLKKEYQQLLSEPVPYVIALPSEKDILTWHYVLFGPPGTPYYKGVYHGTLKFPSEYPLKPPAIQMITPNGRFKTETRLCLSMSDFHPELWNPLWSVGSILTGLLSFMLESKPTTGSIETSDDEKRRLATESREFNNKDASFRRMFEKMIEKYEEENKDYLRLVEPQLGAALNSNAHEPDPKGTLIVIIVFILAAFAVFFFGV